jgi:SAM-dependent methyltransferase
LETDYRCRFCAGASAEPIVRAIRDWEYGCEGEWDFVSCVDCGGVQLHPFPTVADLQRAYDVDYHGYEQEGEKGAIFGVLYALKTRLLKRKLRRFLVPEARVLDVGCGAGGFLEALRSLGLHDLTGIDFSERAISLLEAKGLAGVRGLFVDYDGPRASFDLISMNHYLEHTLDPRAELQRARELLREGGALVGELPGFDSYERRLFGRYWGGNHVPRHTLQLPQEFLVRLLVDCGFREVHVSHELNTGHWALSVQNAAQRGVADLRHNPAVRWGRAWYYFPLLLAFIPLNVLCVLAGKAGVVRFSARA